MTLAMWMPGPLEVTIVGIVMVLLFGHRLPKVARSIGSSLVEFKRGLKGAKEEAEEISKALDIQDDVRQVLKDIEKEEKPKEPVEK